jgi:hypothetical protein
MRRSAEVGLLDIKLSREQLYTAVVLAIRMLIMSRARIMPVCYIGSTVR